MEKRKISLKRTLITNACLLAIIAIVYVMALTPFGMSLMPKEPLLKGTTGGNNVALEIAVNGASDLDAYMDILDTYGVKCTFFFCEQCGYNEELLRQVVSRGHSVGYYTCAAHAGRQTDLYIGGGYSIPVMSYQDHSASVQVCPSIDVSKMKTIGNWQQTLREGVIGDMFIYVDADNDFEDFEKIVQIVLNKGYTILKVNEML